MASAQELNRRSRRGAPSGIPLSCTSSGRSRSPGAPWWVTVGGPAPQELLFPACPPPFSFSVSLSTFPLSPLEGSFHFSTKLSPSPWSAALGTFSKVLGWPITAKGRGGGCRKAAQRQATSGGRAVSPCPINHRPAGAVPGDLGPPFGFGRRRSRRLKPTAPTHLFALSSVFNPFGEKFLKININTAGIIFPSNSGFSILFAKSRAAKHPIIPGR